MFRKKETDVMVVGAGPVGMFAAAELSRRGVPAWIVDEASQAAGPSYALGLHGASLELLDKLDLAEPILKAGRHVDRMAFYEDYNRKLVVDLSAAGGKYPFLTILPQSALEETLEDYLKHHKMKVRWRHRAGAIGTTKRPTPVSLERWEEDYVGYGSPHTEAVFRKPMPVDAQFVVGADGAGSLVRHRLEIDCPEVARPRLFAVFEFHCDWVDNHEAAVIIDDAGLSILWPLPDRRCRWSFEIPDTDHLDADRIKSRRSPLGRWTFPTLDEDRLHELITARAPWFTGQTEEILWSVAIRFEYRLAETFGRDALWLAGDAAHLGGPVGIHSMNVGLREARDLARCLGKILHKNAGDELLREYDQQRRAEWRSLMNLDGQLIVRSDAPEFVRKHATTILSCLPGSGQGLQGLLDQVGLELPAPAGAGTPIST